MTNPQAWKREEFANFATHASRTATTSLQRNQREYRELHVRTAASWPETHGSIAAGTADRIDGNFASGAHPASGMDFLGGSRSPIDSPTTSHWFDECLRADSVWDETLVLI